MIGRVISGRYVVQAVVGTGGMAVVYRAYDKIKKQTVAIKVLRPEYESDMEFVRRFSREAEAASKVSHENIANLLDVGIDGDMRYIVMEYVDGQTLKDMIREKGRINPDQTLRMVIRILAAVDHAHRNGIVHRDIKPQNILVDKQGRVKVADFGIARLKASQTTRIDGTEGASALGSVHYFSPEQAKGEVADEKSDLYSVGVVMYEMLTGTVPFDGETSVSVALKHVSEEPKSMRLSQSGISKALDEVVLRALCKDSTKRYQTAAEMAADLRKTITHPRGGFVKYPLDPEEVERQKELERKQRQRNRRRIVRTVTIVALILLIPLALGLTWFFTQLYNTVQMPYMIGTEQLVAQDTLEQIGLSVSLDASYSEDFEEGLVVAQSRASGDRVKKGSNIMLTVSAGSQWFYMEDYHGKTEAEVREALTSVGPKSVVFEYAQSDGEVGTVIGQSLETGWQSRDSELVITICGQSVLMPALEGMALEGAQALIEAEGLVLGEVVEEYASDAEPHTVISQSVAPNMQVLMGTVVDLTISQQEEQLYYPYSKFTVVVPLNNLSVEIKLIMPSGTEVTAYSEILNAGTHQVELSSTEQGVHGVRVYMDGVMMESVDLMFD